MELYAYVKSIRVVESCRVQVELRGMVSNHVLPPVSQSHGTLLLHLFSLLLLLSQIFSQLFYECRIVMRQQDELVSRGSIAVLRILINVFKIVERLYRKLL